MTAPLVSRRPPISVRNDGGGDGVAQVAYQRQHASPVHRPARLLRREAGKGARSPAGLPGHSLWGVGGAWGMGWREGKGPLDCLGAALGRLTEGEVGQTESLDLAALPVALFVRTF